MRKNVIPQSEVSLRKIKLIVENSKMELKDLPGTPTKSEVEKVTDSWSEIADLDPKYWEHASRCVQCEVVMRMEMM